MMYRHGHYLSPGPFQITTENRGTVILFWYQPYASSVPHQKKGKYQHFSANSHRKYLWRKEQHTVKVEKLFWYINHNILNINPPLLCKCSRDTFQGLCLRMFLINTNIVHNRMLIRLGWFLKVFGINNTSNNYFKIHQKNTRWEAKSVIWGVLKYHEKVVSNRLVRVKFPP